MSERVKCSEDVGRPMGNTTIFHQCQRWSTVVRDGKPYCAQHDPQAVAERKRARDQAYRDEVDEERRKHAQSVDLVRRLGAGTPDYRRGWTGGVVLTAQEAEALADRISPLAPASEGRFPSQELIKVSRDEDLYVCWSNNSEGPVWVGTRAEALAEGCPEDRLARADANGTSMLQPERGCAWDDKGLIAEQRGWLPRAKIGVYALSYLAGDALAFELLEPFPGETEVQRS